jgi:hypothetical protein
MLLSVTSGFRRDADEICSLLGYNAASAVVILYRRFGTTYRSQVQLPFLDFLALGDGTDTFSRNVGKGLPQSTLRYTPEENRSRYLTSLRKLKSKINLNIISCVKEPTIILKILLVVYLIL